MIPYPFRAGTAALRIPIQISPVFWTGSWRAHPHSLLIIKTKLTIDCCWPLHPIPQGMGTSPLSMIILSPSLLPSIASPSHIHFCDTSISVGFYLLQTCFFTCVKSHFWRLHFRPFLVGVLQHLYPSSLRRLKAGWLRFWPSPSSHLPHLPQSWDGQRMSTHHPISSNPMKIPILLPSLQGGAPES